MLIDSRLNSGFRSQPQERQVAGQEASEVRQVQQWFGQFARQSLEGIAASCKILSPLVSQVSPSSQNDLKRIQQAVIQELRAGIKKKKELDEKISTLEQRIRHIDQEIPKVEEALAPEAYGALFLKRVWWVCGSATVVGGGLTACGYDVSKLTAVAFCMTALFAAFWSLPAVKASSLGMQLSKITEESEKGIPAIIAAREEQTQLAARIREIFENVKNAAEQANLADVDEGPAPEDQREPIEIEAPQKLPRFKKEKVILRAPLERQEKNDRKTERAERRFRDDEQFGDDEQFDEQFGAKKRIGAERRFRDEEQFGAEKRFDPFSLFMELQKRQRAAVQERFSDASSSDGDDEDFFENLFEEG